MNLRNVTCALAVAGFFQLFPVITRAESVHSGRDSARHYFSVGKEEQAARRYSTAWKAFEKASTFDVRDADIHLAIADVCTKMNRTAPAIQALEAVSAIRPTDYATQWKLVQLYYNFGRHQKVIDLLPGLHAHMSDTKGWAFMLGKSYYTIQNYGKALEFLKISQKEEPANAEASYLMARMLVKMENYKGAVPHYYRTLSIDSTSQPSRLYEFALVLATAEQFDQSIAYFSKALAHGYQPRDDFYMNMAYTMADAHKTGEALKMMKDMLERRPQDMGLLNGLADVCYHSGRYKEAIAYWDKLLGMDANNARALYQIGLAYIKMGQEKDGQHLCDQAIHMDPALAVLKHAKQLPF